MGKSVKIKIQRQGAPIVNHASIRKSYKKLVAIEVDLQSKYCIVDGYTGDEKTGLMSVSIGTDDRSIKLHPRKKAYVTTEISFPEYKDWHIFCSDLSRYTLRICLIKK